MEDVLNRFVMVGSGRELRGRATVRALPCMVALGLLGSGAGCSPSMKSVNVSRDGGGAAAAVRMTLRERAEQLWSARMAEDWRAVFEFEDPTVRESSTAEEFEAWSRENEPFRVVSYRIQAVEEKGDLGWVSLATQLGVRRFPAAPIRDVERWETWRRIDGLWLPVPRGADDQFPIAPSRRDAEGELALRARFDESWRARRDADWTAFYAFVDPADRGTVDEVSFTSSMDRLRYLNAAVEWVQVVGNQGVVRVDYQHRFNDPNLTKMTPRNLAVNEDWVKVDGVWYVDLNR